MKTYRIRDHPTLILLIFIAWYLYDSVVGIPIAESFFDKYFMFIIWVGSHSFESFYLIAFFLSLWLRLSRIAKNSKEIHSSIRK